MNLFVHGSIDTWLKKDNGINKNKIEVKERPPLSYITIEGYFPKFRFFVFR